MLPVLVRVVALITVIGSILWLYLNKPPRERRIWDLDRALTSHAVGRLNESERRRLQEVVGEVLRALDIRAQAAVDEPFRGDRLNIYTTSPAAAVVTGCGPGNALYDPGLDAIFIDEEFFNFEGYRDIYNASAYGSVSVSAKTSFFRKSTSASSFFTNWAIGSFIAASADTFLMSPN